MACPFLKEGRARYCHAAPVRKLILEGPGTEDGGRCATPQYRQCALVKKDDAPQARCPHLEDIRVQYCGVSPVTKLVPFSEFPAFQLHEQYVSLLRFLPHAGTAACDGPADQSSVFGEPFLAGRGRIRAVPHWPRRISRRRRWPRGRRDIHYTARDALSIVGADNSRSRRAAYQIMQVIADKQGIDRIRMFNREGRLMFSTDTREQPVIIEHGMPGSARDAAGKLVRSEDHRSHKLLFLREEVEIAAESADGDNQDGQRQNQLGSKFSRHRLRRHLRVRPPRRAQKTQKSHIKPNQ